eukprot:TRINITY_DN28661_c0_g1_i1.p1 TRINITY_DN28661_c0_g1~~TRINITY_DN28661_c0_g1_i1.p1  ORF type:complete len:313 (+),score=35.20 TRINITY_DN28661_c0_g1_i1:134-1072(+)
MPNDSAVPKVTVSMENDMLLKPAGKICGRSGMPNLPGGLMRSYSSPQVFSSPGGWHDDGQRRRESRGREYQDQLNRSSALGHAMATGALGLANATQPDPGGARTPGGKLSRTHSTAFRHNEERPPSNTRWHTGAAGFKYCQDSQSNTQDRYPWYDPRGQAEVERLKCPQEPGSHAWMLRKARDHVGYGSDGIVNPGDVQVTAVSHESPTWFLGTRTVPGPLDTKTVPVRRSPWVQIEGKDVKVRAKSYTRGEGLSVIETLHAGPRPEPQGKVAKPKAAAHSFFDHPAKKSNMIHGGCQIREGGADAVNAAHA